jgi:methionyl-tRNA formyltransferase
MTRNPLRLVFMGTPDFAVPALGALLDAGHEVVGVFTQPDRRSGRGRRLSAPPVKEFSESRDLTVFQPASLREDAEARQCISDLAPDAIVVAAYGLFLPEETLAVPRLGCLNIHPSLLPRHRGPSPVATAILEGDETTGVTIMLLDEGMDTGPILNQGETPIGADETCDQLTARLFDVGSNLLTKTLDVWSDGSVTPTPQDDAIATVTTRLQRSDGRIDWNDTVESIARRVRAFTPWPGTCTTWKDRTFKVIRAKSVAATFDVPAGNVVTLNCPDGIGVTTGKGTLRLLEVQVEGRRASTVEDFVRGYPDFVGSRLGD